MDDLVIDLDVCLIEYKGNLDPVLYEVYCFPNNTSDYALCMDKLNDRAIQEFGRELLPEEVDLLSLIMFNSQRYPAMMMASLIDQVFYWKSMDPDVIERIARGEDDES